MTDYLTETPPETRAYCPGCEPTVDPMVEVVVVYWCDPHRPLTEGASDRLVTREAHLSGGTEAGGDDNRAWCDFFHRGRV